MRGDSLCSDGIACENIGLCLGADTLAEIGGRFLRRAERFGGAGVSGAYKVNSAARRIRRGDRLQKK